MHADGNTHAFTVLYNFYWFPPLHTYQMFLCVFDLTLCPVNEVFGFSHITDNFLKHVRHSHVHF